MLSFTNLAKAHVLSGQPSQDLMIFARRDECLSLTKSPGDVIFRPFLPGSGEK